MDTTQHAGINHNIKGYLLIVGAGVGYATTLTIHKEYLHDVNGFLNIFWLSLSGATMSALVMLAIETQTFPKSAKCILLLLGHSTSATAA